MFISGVNDTIDKLFGVANDTAVQFSVISGVVDTGDKFITGVVDTTEQLLPVTTTPATFINSALSPDNFHR
jgi:hypothetical protein